MSHEKQSPVILKIDANVSDFLEKARPVLLLNQEIHSFLLGFVNVFAKSAATPSLLARLETLTGQTVIAALQTESERAVFISHATAAVTEKFAELLAEKLGALPGVHGPQADADTFAARWCRVLGVQAKLGFAQRLFRLDKLVPPRPVSGGFRLAEPRDRDLLFQWLREFAAEAVPSDPKPSDEALYRGIDNGIKAAQYFLWEEAGECVSLVGSRRETNTDRWIAPVYTPPPQRGKGFASALMAVVSERILESEKTPMLFTDLANPTSNSVYQKLGYRPVADFKLIEFI